MTFHPTVESSRRLFEVLRWSGREGEGGVGGVAFVFAVFILTSPDSRRRVPLCSPHVSVHKAPRGLDCSAPGYPLTLPPSPTAPLLLLLTPHPHPTTHTHKNAHTHTHPPVIPGSGDLMKSSVTINDLSQSLCHRSSPPRPPQPTQTWFTLQEPLFRALRKASEGAH